MQVFKRVGVAFEAAVGEKFLETQFNARRFFDAGEIFPTFQDVFTHVVSVLVFLDESVHFFFRNGVRYFHQVADAVGVHGVTKLHLRGDLVTFGHGHFAHVVAETDELRTLPVGPRGSGTRPRADFFLSGFLLPETNDYFAVDPQAAHDETVLAIAVRRLIHVHEIHVDRAPRQIAVVLRVQMADRFAELLESVDPHLRRRERVAPRHETDALRGVVRLLTEFGDGVRRNHDRLENNFHRNRAGFVQRGGDFLRMFRDGFEGFGSVKMLAAGDKPDFVLFKVNGHKFLDRLITFSETNREPRGDPHRWRRYQQRARGVRRNIPPCRNAPTSRRLAPRVTDAPARRMAIH